MRASWSRSAARSSGRGARAQAHPPGAAHRGHQAETHRARDAGLRRARVSAAANSTRRALHHGESGDYWKMTYSRMAFSSRPCVLPELPAKCRHTGTLTGGSRCACRGSSSSTGAALVRSLTVSPFLNDGLERDGAGRKEAAGPAVAVPHLVGSFEHDAMPLRSGCLSCISRHEL